MLCLLVQLHIADCIGGGAGGSGFESVLLAGVFTSLHFGGGLGGFFCIGVARVQGITMAARCAGFFSK